MVTIISNYFRLFVFSFFFLKVAVVFAVEEEGNLRSSVMSKLEQSQKSSWGWISGDGVHNVGMGFQGRETIYFDRDQFVLSRPSIQNYHNKCKFIFQGDSNLVFYDFDGRVVWASNTCCNNGNTKLVFQVRCWGFF